MDEFDQANQQPPEPNEANQVSADNPFKIGIVGKGFVGKAVEYAFYHPMTKIMVVDPKHSDNTIEDLYDFEPEIVFVCLPTPMNAETGFVDSSLVEDATIKLISKTEGIVVVKSTITPDVVDRIYAGIFKEDVHRFCYNPEFLTESNAIDDFVNADSIILGGTPQVCGAVSEIYDVFSVCHTNEFYRMSAAEASFVKYTINSFLSVKLTFFNQLYDLVNWYGCSYNIITRAVGADPRIGIGHTRVPGYDGKRGFGGACLPKDSTAFAKFAEAVNEDGERVGFTLIEKALEINKNYRKQYEPEFRELENNVNFKNTSDEESKS